MKKIGFIWLFTMSILIMQGQTAHKARKQMLKETPPDLAERSKANSNASSDWEMKRTSKSEIKNLVCDANSLFNNPATGTNASTISEEARELKVASEFTIDGAIETITFWGYSGFHDGSQWGNCNDADPMVFDLVVYENNNDSIGAQFSIVEDVTATSTPTGEMFDPTFEIIEYTINLTTPIEGISNGFLSLVSQSDNDCWFLWTNSPSGSGNAYLYLGYNNTWDLMDYAYSLCINGTLNTCPYPTSLAADNITDNSAELSWTEMGSSTEWGLALNNIAMGSSSNTLTSDNPYTATSLDANTDYSYSLRSVCGVGDTSLWSPAFGFRTECVSVTTFPFFEDFDGDWDTWCWTIIDADNDGETWEQANDYVTPYSGDYTAHGAGNQNDYLITPALEIEPDMQVSWYAMVEDVDYPNNYEILVSTTGIEIDDFTDTLGKYECTNTSMEEIVLGLSDYANQTIYIAIHQTYSEDAWYGFGIDDFKVRDVPTCFKPTDLEVTNIAQTSVDLAWTENGGATTWNIEYGDIGFTQGTGTTITVTDNPYTLNSLSSGTVYDFYVQADCGGGDLSDWSEPEEFMTACGLYTDLDEDFEGDYFPPLCWNTFANVPEVDLWEEDYNLFGGVTKHGMKSIMAPGNDAETWLVTPQVTIPAGKQLSFFATDIYLDKGQTLKVMVTTSSDYLDTASYQEIVFIEESNVFSPAELTGFNADISSYAGQDVFIAFVANGVDDWFLDDVHFSSCGLPVYSNTFNSTHNTIELEWEGNADSYTIEYGPYNFAQGSGTTANVTGNSFQLTGLQEISWFDYYIRSNCSGGDTSLWDGPHTTKTDRLDCPPITTYPYFEGFEGIAHTNDIDCLTLLSNRDREGGLNPTKLIASQNYFGLDTGNPYEGQACLGMSFFAPGYQWILSPAFEVPAEGIDFTFAMWYTSFENRFSKVHINVLDYTDDTWTVVKTYEYEDDINQYERLEKIDLESYANKTIKVAIVHEQDGGEAFYVDNIKVDVKSPMNDENDILSFTLANQTQDATINSTNHTVKAVVLEGTGLTSLVPTFTLSNGASATIGGTIQVSGTTSNDFSSPVTYSVQAENGDIQDWEVTVTENIGVSNITSQEFRVFPNPFKDELIIETSNGSSVKLVTIDGRILVDQIVTEDNKLRVDTKNFPDGIFLVKVRSGNRCQTLKIVK